MKNASIYMIPSSLGECRLEKVIPSYISDLVVNIDHYIVENIRTARRFLKKVNKEIDINNIEFFVLNKHTRPEEISEFLNPAMNGKHIGVLSEAGCPGIADPGSEIVRLAYKNNIRVIPLSGPSSIIMALMASGFNGQNFAFNGYLAIKKPERIKQLRSLEKRSKIENQSQIFMETPYRNTQMFNDICEACSPETFLCIATDISLDTEKIRSQKVKSWKKSTPDINKKPSIFILYSE